MHSKNFEFPKNQTSWPERQSVLRGPPQIAQIGLHSKQSPWLKYFSKLHVRQLEEES
jgi:hypothetical protein